MKIIFSEHNGMRLKINKRKLRRSTNIYIVQNAALGCNLKNERMPSVQFQDKPSHSIVIEVYAPTIKAKEAEVYKEQQDIL